MTIPGRFNVDAKALDRRIQAHDKFGSNDLNQWIFGHLDVREGISVLDLGCGTGKQSIPLAGALGKDGRVLCVDISKEALDSLSKEAAREGLSERVRTLRTGFDDFHARSHRSTFDRVVSSYSLYYAENPEGVMKTVREVLKERGVFFFCGPSRDNNRELKHFHYRLKGRPAPPVTGGALFMEETGPRIARALFDKVEIFTFSNPLRFDSAEALYTYWSSYNLYEDELDESFRTAAAEHFRGSPVFMTRKRVIGVRAVT